MRGELKMKIYIYPKVEEFISNLSNQHKAKILRTVDLLEKFGSKLRMPHSKKVSKKIFELRIRGVKEFRILYTFHKKSAVLLNIFIKKSQKISKNELETTKNRLNTLD